MNQRQRPDPPAGDAAAALQALQKRLADMRERHLRELDELAGDLASLASLFHSSPTNVSPEAPTAETAAEPSRRKVQLGTPSDTPGPSGQLSRSRLLGRSTSPSPTPAAPPDAPAPAPSPRPAPAPAPHSEPPAESAGKSAVRRSRLLGRPAKDEAPDREPPPSDISEATTEVAPPPPAQEPPATKVLKERPHSGKSPFSTGHLTAPDDVRRMGQDAANGANPESSAPAEASPPQPGARQPAPQVAEDLKKAMFRLRQTVDTIARDMAVPEIGVEVSRQVVDSLVDRSHELIQAFLNMHATNRARVDERLQQHLADGESIRDSRQLWDHRMLDQYETFRTIRFVEDFLDPLEALWREAGEPACDALLDCLAAQLDLEPIAVVPGASQFDPDRHEAPGQQPKQGATITANTRTGYVDLHAATIVRRAIVTVEPPPRPGKTGTFILDRDEAIHGGPPTELPVPEEVSSCRSRVFKTKIAVSNLTKAGKLPKSGEPIDPGIAALMRDYSNWLLQRFTAMHTMCQASANQAYNQLLKTDPEHAVERAWDPELIAQYAKFRDQTAIEGFLDRLEAKIRAAKLDDHLQLVENVAREMDLVRLLVEPRKQTFDPQRHQLSRQVDAMHRDALRRAQIKAVILPGYADVMSGAVTRKALVEVRMPATASETDVDEGDYEVPVDLDD